MFKNVVKTVSGDISILWDSQNKDISIEIEDRESSSLISLITLSAEDFCHAALGRLAKVKCNVGVGELEKVGKKMIIDRLKFEIPKELWQRKEMKEVAEKLAVEKCLEGWKCDLYFDSQDSFFTEDGKQFAQCTIRKWVDK
jgi:hypothetical protein